MTAPDPAVVELLRQRSGLSIDRDGRFLHRGEPITHARTLEVLWGSLERNADGRYQVHVGREVGYVTVEDAPYGVRGVTWADGGADLHLTDGSVERLDPSTLTIGADGVLRCRVKRGAHRARFSRGAQVALGLELRDEPDAPGRYRLQLGGVSFAVIPE